MGKEIEADKITLTKLFEDFWFLIPEYQRPYVWTPDNINDLLEDLWFAYKNNPDDEYFVGSLVLKRIRESDFYEYEVLDGQQRLTTFAILFAVLRELTNEELLKKTLKDKLFQQENPYDNIPERHRIIYKIRGESNNFLKEFIMKGNRKYDGSDISVRNMIKAIETIESFFQDADIEGFAKFLLPKVVFIYVATKDREDAFRLFTILNNRGIPLTNADILKSINIGEIEKYGNNSLSEQYAKKWEDLQNELADSFDRFLGFIRTILIKDKARKNLLEEFEEKIYKEGRLSKGKETIDLIYKYYEIYTKIIVFSSEDQPLTKKDSIENNEYKNLITVMKTALPSTDWMPPLLYFYWRFGDQFLLMFLKKLELKFSSDWILYFTPAKRIENMNKILKKIEYSDNPEAVIDDDRIFAVNIDDLKNTLSADIYGKRFVKYVLLKYEFLIQNNSQFIGNYSSISVEHILPQNPSNHSKWREWFTNEEIEQYKHKIGNLVLLNRRKNSSLSNLDFDEKKERYFKGSISTFPSINHIMRKTKWQKNDIEERTKDMIKKLIFIS